MLPFTYEKLALKVGQIRLLKLLRPFGGMVQCSLEVVKHSQNLDYEALSYAWGKRSKTRAIEVNGQELQISLNLWEFLDRSSRYVLVHPVEGGRVYRPEAPHYLWIDQICIDQSSVEEKNHQVQRMAEIYEQATWVTLWVGPGTPENELLIDTLSNGWYTLNFGDDYGTRKAQEAQVLESVETLFAQPYWSRLWVIQEILLAKQVVISFGKRSMLWTKLYDHNAIKDLVLDISVPPRLGSRALAISTSVKTLLQRKSAYFVATGNDKRFTLEAALANFSTLQCEDPRDKVYGLIALISTYVWSERDSHRRLKPVSIRVDYSEDAPMLFWRIVALLLDHEESYFWSNDWLVPLGVAMGVTGKEPAAMIIEARDLAFPHAAMVFVWPQGFVKI